MRWRRFDNNEVNCTVQMYRHSRECNRRDRRFALISVHLEPIDVTPYILEGKQSTTTSKRPLKQALWRAFKITRALRSLIVVAALVDRELRSHAPWWVVAGMVGVYRSRDGHGDVVALVAR